VQRIVGGGKRAVSERKGPRETMTTTDRDVAADADVARLFVGGHELALPVERATEGQPAFNIAPLLKEAGVLTLDYGYANTASTRSAITYLDGDRGILRYRGYPIEELADSATFLEVAYLLIHGELPTPRELEAWEGEIRRHTLIREEFRRFFDAFPKDAHPMAVLGSAVSALSAFYPHDDTLDEAELELSTVRLLAKLPTLAAAAYKKLIGQAVVYPDNSLDYEANFLKMMFAVPAEPYACDPDAVRAMRTLLILHADHEQNCSTSTVRMVGSSHANLYATISAGIWALWGRLHGGANQEVIEMLQGIAADGGDVEAAVRRAKDKGDPYRLMGFGHRVYKNYDPRARLIRAVAEPLLAKTGQDDQLLRIAKELEQVALSDPYFIQRQLYPNVDFYSGLIYRALGFPAPMFTVLFAIGRLPGWIAQWREMLADPDSRIGRPRQLYVGHPQRAFVPLEDR
jgi:citrate synthase